MKNNLDNRGFSLIELLIVVVIIGILAAVSIPNLLASRRAMNEASALRSLRVMSSAEAIYHSTNGNGASYGTAAQLYTLGLIDRVVAAANNVNVGGSPPTNTAKSGFLFRIQITAGVPATGTPPTYVISAVPSSTTGPTQTGAKRLCLTDNGLMKSGTTALATHYTYATCNSATAFRP